MLSMTTKVSKVVDRSSNIIAALNQLKRRQVMVGVPAEKAARDSKGAQGSPINNAALAYIHNYGSPTVNIPPRPFMEPGIKNAQDKINRQMEKAASSAFDGRRDAVEKGLIAAGTVAATSIKAKITAGPFAPLKPATLAARRRRGRTGTKPLLDTGKLRNAINFVVRNKV